MRETQCCVADLISGNCSSYLRVMLRRAVWESDAVTGDTRGQVPEGRLTVNSLQSFTVYRRGVDPVPGIHCEFN